MGLACLQNYLEQKDLDHLLAALAELVAAVELAD